MKFEMPDSDCRLRLWKRYLPKKLPNNVNLKEIAEKFDGISGSDISNAVLNAAFKAARRKMTFVDKALLFESVEDIMKSRQANEMSSVSKRKVPEEYVKAQTESKKIRGNK